MKRTFSAVMFILLLTSILTLAFNIQPVWAQGTIYIRADGSIDPPTTPISTVDNVTYTLVDNITDSIVVERDNIVVDGLGCSIQGTGIGIDLDGRSNVTIKNTNILGFYGGYGGIRLYESSNNNLFGNNITANSWYGIYLYESSNNTFRDNHMTDNEANFGVYAETFSNFINDVDTSNLVNGKSIYYWINKQNMVVPLDAGYVALVNCTGITVQYLDLTKNVQSLLLAGTTNSTITQNNMTKNQGSFTEGIRLWDSSDNTICGNNINAIGENGVVLYQSSKNRIIWNNITNNGRFGIYLYEASNNTVSGNCIADTYRYSDSKGVLLDCSSNNIIDGNIVTENGGEGIVLRGSSNNTIIANNVSDNGYYLDDFGIDLTYCSMWEGCWPTSYSDNNTIIGNNVTRNTSGIRLRASGYNNLNANAVTDNRGDGIHMETASQNILRDNVLAGNKYNFGVFTFYDEVDLSTYAQDIDTSNTVNGKPIYFLQDQRDLLIDSSDIGYLALVNCTNVTVRNLSLTDNGQGLLLAFTTNSTIQNVTVAHNRVGIHVLGSNANIIAANSIFDNQAGVNMYIASTNNITGNIMTDNGISVGSLILGWSTLWTSAYVSLEGNKISWNKIHGGGISLSNPGATGTLVANNEIEGSGILLEWHSGNNILTGNNIANGTMGIELDGSSNNTLRSNKMSDNQFNFALRGNELSDFVNDVDDSNTVNGKTVCYWIEKRDESVPADAGYVALINSQNITVRGLQLRNNGEGILLFDTTASEISKNNITENEFGIVLLSSSNNSLYKNNIEKNYYGIELADSLDNSIYHNNFVTNSAQVLTWNSTNVWHNGYPSGGNYWSDCNDADVYRGLYQNETGSDGIGDTQYVIDGDNADRYPLMKPYVALLGDVNGDGTVDMKDVMAVVQAFNSFPGTARWNPNADIDNSGRVDMRDLVIIVLNFNKHE